MEKALTFFFQSYNKCLSDFFLRFGQTICLQRTTKKALFLPLLRSLLITYLIFVSLEKIIVWTEVLNFGSKDLYEFCGF